MFKNLKQKAFTMAEVMIVLAIVTVVVAISVKVTKAKFEAANRYLYYTAYSTLRTLVAEVHLAANTIDAAAEAPPADFNLHPIPSSADNNLCTNINSFANLKNTATVCGGSSKASIESVLARVNPEDWDFTLLTPDLVLRNGMRIYNMRETYNIPLFSNLVIYNENGTPNPTLTAQARRVYKVFVDIDGERNSSVLWEDVYPFYVTLNGYLIPAYNTDGIGGANNLSLLATSIQYDDINAATNRSVEKWLMKNVTWQEAACRAGFVNGNYCSGIATNATCVKSPTNYANCRVKVIAPLKM